MQQAPGFAKLIGIGMANGILIGAAFATARPLYYLGMALVVGTFINLTYVISGRLWQERR